MMQEEGEQIGRFKVRRLMRELELVSKQPGSHTYKKATVERPDIPSILNPKFDVEAPNQVWCGDITYIWAQGKWHYLAVVLDTTNSYCLIRKSPDSTDRKPCASVQGADKSRVMWARACCASTA